MVTLRRRCARALTSQNLCRQVEVGYVITFAGVSITAMSTVAQAIILKKKEMSADTDFTWYSTAMSTVAQAKFFASKFFFSKKKFQ